MEEPILVSGTDGVGTKLKIAFELDKHDTIGVDAVAMCVNDIVCCGAQPLFFLDYIACGKNYPEKIASIVGGIADGCRQSGAALIGGETAEMPGFYPENEYDLAGFAVGIVDKKSMIDGSKVAEGDVIIGLPSSGIHSNGYSLVRKLFQPNKEKLALEIDGLNGTLGEALLTPTRIYVKTIAAIKEVADIHAISHITGGGFYENIPRMLPDGVYAEISKGSWPILPIFNVIQSSGDIKEEVMYSTFNMGIGMMIAVKESEVEATLKAVQNIGEVAYRIGQVKAGEKGVTIC